VAYAIGQGIKEKSLKMWWLNNFVKAIEWRLDLAVGLLTLPLGAVSSGKHNVMKVGSIGLLIIGSHFVTPMP
jgi:hypothetical protein